MIAYIPVARHGMTRIAILTERSVSYTGPFPDSFSDVIDPHELVPRVMSVNSCFKVIPCFSRVS